MDSNIDYTISLRFDSTQIGNDLPYQLALWLAQYTHSAENSAVRRFELPGGSYCVLNPLAFPSYPFTEKCLQIDGIFYPVADGEPQFMFGIIKFEFVQSSQMYHLVQVNVRVSYVKDYFDTLLQDLLHFWKVEQTANLNT